MISFGRVSGLVTLLLAASAGIQGCASAPSAPVRGVEGRGGATRALQADVEEAIRGFEGVVGVYARRLGEKDEVAIRADETFPTASLVKVPILLGLLDRVEKREVSWAEPLTFTKERAYPGEELLGRFADGETVSLAELVFLMESKSDNSASLSTVMRFGKFEFLCCGDLTWNTEAKLMMPNNPLGQIDLYMVTHHGLNVSNNPVLVKAIDPVVSVCCNGPTKGGAKETIDTLKACPSLKAMYQLHRNVNLKDEEQTPKEFIANTEPTVNCAGQWIKASVAPDGASFTVQIGPDGEAKTYQSR